MSSTQCTWQGPWYDTLQFNNGFLLRALGPVGPGLFFAWLLDFARFGTLALMMVGAVTPPQLSLTIQMWPLKQSDYW